MFAFCSALFAISWTLAPQTHLALTPARQPVQRLGSPTCAQKQQTPDEVVEKYGLEAGLFSALKKGGSGDGKVTAGELLKRYGGAYLLTSTSFAIVSFALCYLAVDNGVDVAALLEKVGLEVVVPKEAGTIGLAYAIHKAASPIRFPPTVALTPVVAKRLFKNDGSEPKAE
ncbi:hypothetical protein Ctob_005703 [Chrysochromulina tobinii]|uniref:DUF1279 domain-containing protein n=1 Tax=Chrysochromulina tobinii TaxID=1460289 RepID=A0A0M0JGR7_9EUKA|nr:hypothetical protein Ctob_005703 [Chrysochromulina tobinii]|eukprot:KOO25517.1 hypothetical protein Ctob_005703 [Chrysochromulina sp. CCMP291]